MYCLSYAHFFPFFPFFFGLFCSSASVCIALFLCFFFSFTTRKLAFPTFSPSGFDPSSLSRRSFKMTFLFSLFLSFLLNRVHWGHELLSKSGSLSSLSKRFIFFFLVMKTDVWSSMGLLSSPSYSSCRIWSNEWLGLFVFISSFLVFPPRKSFFIFFTEAVCLKTASAFDFMDITLAYYSGWRIKSLSAKYFREVDINAPPRQKASSKNVSNVFFCTMFDIT